MLTASDSGAVNESLVRPEKDSPAFKTYHLTKTTLRR